MEIYFIMLIFYFIGYFFGKLFMPINNTEIDIIILSILFVMTMIRFDIVVLV